MSGETTIPRSCESRSSLEFTGSLWIEIEYKWWVSVMPLLAWSPLQAKSNDLVIGLPSVAAGDAIGRRASSGLSAGAGQIAVSNCSSR